MPVYNVPYLAETAFWNEKGKDLLLSRRNIDPTKVSITAKHRIRVACEACGKEMSRTLNRWCAGHTMCQDCEAERRAKREAKREAERQAQERADFGKGTMWGDLPWQVILLWDWKKNDKAPWEVSAHGNHAVHLVCLKCGEEFERRAVNLYRSIYISGNPRKICPTCGFRVLKPGVNDLATTDPEVAAHWHPTKNGKLTPRDVMRNARQRVWWVYDNGEEGRASVYQKVRAGFSKPSHTAERHTAPLTETHPGLCDEWDYENNGDFTPEKTTYGSSRKVFWECRQCGYIWQATIKSRAMIGCGCPKCAIKGNSNGEKAVRQALSSLGLHYKVEHRIDECRDKAPLPFDFAITVKGGRVILLIEYQGRQHDAVVPMWGGEEGLEYRRRHDQIKRDYCETSGIPLLEIPHTMTEPEEIVRALLDFIDVLTPPKRRVALRRSQPTPLCAV